MEIVEPSVCLCLLLFFTFLISNSSYLFSQVPEARAMVMAWYCQLDVPFLHISAVFTIITVQVFHDAYYCKLHIKIYSYEWEDAFLSLLPKLQTGIIKIISYNSKPFKILFKRTIITFQSNFGQFDGISTVNAMLRVFNV